SREILAQDTVGAMDANARRAGVRLDVRLGAGRRGLEAGVRPRSEPGQAQLQRGEQSPRGTESNSAAAHRPNVTLPTGKGATLRNEIPRGACRRRAAGDRLVGRV